MVEGLMVGNHYKIGKYMSEGSFGQLHYGKNINTGEAVAIKIEKKKIDAPQLPLEFRFYKIIGEHKGFPKIYYFAPCGEYHALVMELLGPSLESRFDQCERKFSVKTTLQLALQLMSIIEWVHSKKLIYRDIKPENFLFGRKGTPESNSVHLIDFGLAKEYIENGQHIKFRSGKVLTGTARYMSVNTHRGLEQSRRDDLEAIGYMLMYFLKSQLPWQGLQAKSTRQRYEKIGQTKANTKVTDLCSGFPEEFAKYLKNVKSLEFTQEPDYKEYVRMFNDCFNRLGYRNEVYDWELPEHQRELLPNVAPHGPSNTRITEKRS